MTRSATRREFLATTSLALASTALGARGLRAQQLPPRFGSQPLVAETVFPALTPAMQLRALATTAMDAAKQAGASYADIRLGEPQWIDIGLQSGALEPGLTLRAEFAFGVRVLVDGAWAFVHGRTPTADAVSAAVRAAVTTARGFASLATHRVELAPAPVATGEWAVPCELDPFVVPLQDQAALLGAFQQSAGRVRYGGAPGTSFRWIREIRVLASTEGTLITQTLRQASPSVIVSGGIGNVPAIYHNMFQGGAGGYELVATPGVQDEILRQTEECVRLAWLPRRPFDVGRYPVVFDGAMVASFLGRTLGPALEADRVLGYEADAAGSSFVSPPAEMLGSVIASPLLTVTANRAAPAAAAAKWDDEGVETHEYPVITEGRLVNYHTSRETAAALRAVAGQRPSQPQQQQQPLRSHGCAMAWAPDNPVMVRTPHLTMSAGTKTASLEDLYKDMARGLVVVGPGDVATDQQFVSGSYTGRDAETFEVERGKIVRRVYDNGLQFRTDTLLKGLVALGDARTMRGTKIGTVFKGMPWRWAEHSVHASAALFKEVNVIAVGMFDPFKLPP